MIPYMLSYLASYFCYITIYAVCDDETIREWSPLLETRPYIVTNYLANCQDQLRP